MADGLFDMQSFPDGVLQVDENTHGTRFLFRHTTPNTLPVLSREYLDGLTHHVHVRLTGHVTMGMEASEDHHTV